MPFTTLSLGLIISFRDVGRHRLNALSGLHKINAIEKNLVCLKSDGHGLLCHCLR